MDKVLKALYLLGTMTLILNCEPHQTENLNPRCMDRTDHSERVKDSSQCSIFSTGSCVSGSTTYCGKKSPDGCWCDDLCINYNDCCADKEEVCDNIQPTPDPKSCLNHCDQKAPGGCWCDDLCEKYNDCCVDKKKVCDNIQPTPTVEPTPTPTPCPACLPCMATVTGRTTYPPNYNYCKPMANVDIRIKSRHCSGAQHIATGTTDELGNFTIEIESCGVEDGSVYGLESTYKREGGLDMTIECNKDNHAEFVMEPNSTNLNNFEFDRNWVVNPNGTDTATHGSWIRGIPEETSKNGILYQLDYAASPTKVMATDPHAGKDADSYDVDGGVTSIRSPTFVPNGNGDTFVWLRYVFSHDENATDADYLRVTLVGTSKKEVLLEERGSSSIKSAVWKTFEKQISGYVDEKSYLLVEVADNQNDSLIEAMLDDVTVYTVYPTPMPLPPKPPNKKQLWVSNGTAQGTQILKEYLQSINHCAEGISNKILFTGSDKEHGNELWISDGTSLGTILLKDIYPGSSGSLPNRFTAMNNSVFFQATEGPNGAGLWKTDGTQAGTELVKGIKHISDMIEFNGQLILGLSDGNSGAELWKSDGTASGTVMIKDIYPGSQSSYPTAMAILKGMVLFRASDNIHNSALWKTDGTKAGTKLVKDIYPNSALGLGDKIHIVQGLAYFLADDGKHGLEIWRSDGTEAGTFMIKDMKPVNHVRQLIPVGDRLFFISDKSLWQTDGTEKGTVPVQLLDSQQTPYSYVPMAVMNNDLYVETTECDYGQELWKFNWKDDGLGLFTDINTGPQHSVITIMGVTQNMLWFYVRHNATEVLDFDLWKTDGSKAQTNLVKELLPFYSNGTKVCGEIDGQILFLPELK